MPNWCFNSLCVSGSNKAIAEFAKWLEKGEGDDSGFKLNKIDPLPAALDGSQSPTENPESDWAKEMREKYGFDNWYDWQIAHWGTKWDVNADCEKTDNGFCITFESAWSPPTTAILTLAKEFSSLSFDLLYQESGMGFAGKMSIKGSKMTEKYFEESKDKKSYRQFMMEEWGEDIFDEDN